MATRKKTRPAAKPKARPRVKAKVRAKAPDKLECSVCGYRVIVDETCGCVEEHVLICCGRPMVRK